MDLLQSVIDSSSHAIFTIDHAGTVTHINRQAKERFGLFNHSRHSHGAGRAQKGDVIVLATTALGADDGNLTVEDLSVLGIHDQKIRRGDLLIAVGVFSDPTVKPVYKFLRPGDNDTLRLDVTFQGVPIHAAIENGVVLVRVWEREYSINYFRTIGQLVIIDRSAGRVKFWEENGYSARKEGIGDLLRGATYIAKSPNMEVDVVGYHFRDFFEGELFEKHLQQVMNGAVPSYEDQEYEINGFALTANLLPIEDEYHQIAGVIVKFRNIADIRTTIMERNRAIAIAERQYKATQHPHLFDTNAFTSLFGNSTAMAAVKRYAYKLSGMDCPVLITGENGTGKTELGQVMAEAQPGQGPFITVDCAALRPEEWDTALFGDGGAFSQAQGGIVLLDEIGEMPPAIQSKLLPLLSETRTPKTGVRIFATTSKDLKSLMTEGKFRSDLYYRLNAFSLELPPLRQCREDIPFLINDVMERVRRKYDLPEKYLSGEAFGMLLSYDWPGNIRELENTLERAATLSEGDIIYPEHIRLEVSPTQPGLRQQLKEVEKRIILQTLQTVAGDKKKAQEILGISRTVFYDKLKEYDLH